MELIVKWLAFAAALGSGLIAGTFFIFSVAVMGALGRLAPAEGMRAMQAVNVVILNPVFLGVFLGTALLSAAIFITGLLKPGQPGAVFLLIAALLYILGSFVVTMAFNVPLNNTLAAADPATADGQAVWANYLSSWTLWNHVRALASLLSSAAFIAGIYYSR